MTSPLLQALSLQKMFVTGSTRTNAVQSATLIVNKGEKIAITGPSGCGKTTLLNMLGLVLQPTGGTLLLEGRPAQDLSPARRAALRNSMFGYVVQEYALVESNTVYDNIEIPLLYAKPHIGTLKRREKIDRSMEAVGLAVKRRERVKNLSGGQRQRVAIARALVNDPDIILADEPTGSLDSENSDMVFSLLDQMVQQGKTLILVTHDLNLASRCHRVLHMADGHLTDSPKEADISVP